MTKHDYQLIARVLAEYPLTISEKKELVRVFCEEFQADNKKFNRAKFLAAVFLVDEYL